MPSSRVPFRKAGLLVAVEGLDGSGKTTLVHGLAARLREDGRAVVVTGRNDTTEIYDLQMRLTAADDLDGDMRCIFGGVELAARYHYVLRPALRRGDTVLASKYLATAFAQSLARGHDEAFVARIYEFVLEPDVTFYLDATPELCLRRKQQAGERVGFWEAGLDVMLGLPLDAAFERYHAGAVPPPEVEAAFLAFQARVADLHRDHLRGRPVVHLDATLAPPALVDAAMEALAVLS